MVLSGGTLGGGTFDAGGAFRDGGTFGDGGTFSGIFSCGTPDGGGPP